MWSRWRAQKLSLTALLWPTATLVVPLLRLSCLCRHCRSGALEVGDAPLAFTWADGTPVAGGSFVRWRTSAFRANVDGCGTVGQDGWWDEELCSEVLRGVCSAEPQSSFGVTVTLPASAGTITPPNAATLPGDVGVVTYASPSATLSVIGAPGAIVHSAVATVAVEWTTVVTGVTASDFTVSVPASGRALTGSGRQYTLSLELSPTDVPLCPPLYVAGDGAMPWCVRAMDTTGSWDFVESLCAPYSLAHASSAEQNAVVAQARTWSAQSYWYVSLGPHRFLHLFDVGLPLIHSCDVLCGRLQDRAERRGGVAA